MPKMLQNKGKAKVHEKLEGFDIKINPFGEMNSNISVDKLNDFLNENVEDKKLIHLSEEE